MELKQYATIVWKRIWIPILLVVVVGVVVVVIGRTNGEEQVRESDVAVVDEGHNDTTAMLSCLWLL